MPEWNAEELAQQVLSGQFDGRLNEVLAKLSKEQLIQLLQVLSDRTKTREAAESSRRWDGAVEQREV